jgi:hypothetical protein
MEPNTNVADAVQTDIQNPNEELNNVPQSADFPPLVDENGQELSPEPNQTGQTIQPLSNDVQLKLGYDKENDLFNITMGRGGVDIFQVKFVPQNFQALSNDMIRIVKDYNLMQAKVYQDKLLKIEGEDEKNPMENGKEATQGLEGTSEQSPNA